MLMRIQNHQEQIDMFEHTWITNGWRKTI